MHWLPLVAMVIASALPFPHNPATTPPDSGSSREHRRDPTAHLAALSVRYNLRGNVSQMEDEAAPLNPDRTQNLNDRKDYAKFSTREETSTLKMESQITYQAFGNSGTDDRGRVRLDVASEAGALRTGGISKDNSLQKDYKADGSISRKDFSRFSDFSKDDTQQDVIDTPVQASTAKYYDVVSPATMLKGQRQPEPTVSSRRAQLAPSTRTEARTSAAEDILTVEAGMDLGAELDGFLKGDEIFLDSHPRVLFSPSPLPPEHPPLLLMLESGGEEDGDGGGQEDLDEHIEGHGDRAIDRITTPSWVDYSKVGFREADRPVKRSKRSHLVDNRRGEKAVCESESGWVYKKTAINVNRINVTVMEEIQTQAGPVRQFFYETRCRQAEQPSVYDRTKGTGRSVGTGVSGAGCLGVDKKQWRSECKVKQSFVRALIRNERNQIGWQWIRIDSSCVCVLLSRTKKEVLTRGRG
ncbi:uncharacterized protein [Nothobranchius furzeri]|uniref:Neurotrophin-4 n=2 Tax=Nothobranchius furzeri TaxID=105023 RepID=A0A8C6KG71_NOTFU|nr:uncharacterized protein LOC107378435 [Nothobranchius furzeri]XP_015804126.1 uncharacterized protein LOC107378435 [Nothobranchius furzeri]KAF7225717.1 transcript variant X2 [Nothobranchius furzeri]KAF7225718.1 transcript variant X1 [Nothobranchius furzeri]